MRPVDSGKKDNPVLQLLGARQIMEGVLSK